MKGLQQIYTEGLHKSSNSDFSTSPTFKNQSLPTNLPSFTQNPNRNQLSHETKIHCLTDSSNFSFGDTKNDFSLSKNSTINKKKFLENYQKKFSNKNTQTGSLALTQKSKKYIEDSSIISQKKILDKNFNEKQRKKSVAYNQYEYRSPKIDKTL